MDLIRWVIVVVHALLGAFLPLIHRVFVVVACAILVPLATSFVLGVTMVKFND